MDFTLSIKNYRGLREARWSPRGVCALVGPNGAGKTTLLDALELLQHGFSRNFIQAVELHGGVYAFKRFDAAKDERVSFGLVLREPGGGLEWTYEPAFAGTTLSASESLRLGDESPNAFPAANLVEFRVRGIFDTGHASVRVRVQPLVDLLVSYRFFPRYQLGVLRERGSPLSSDLELGPEGLNVFSVLRNWRDRKAYRDRWSFVVESLREVFPAFFQDLDFESAAGIVGVSLVSPTLEQTLPARLAPDGWFVALLHLTAVASTQKGIVAIDEPENALHPFAIRKLMECFRDWSARHDVTVLLATHSPVILDTFRDEPENVYVMEPGHPVLPVPLPELKPAEWLAHFSLGDLYTKLKIGAPAEESLPVGKG